MEIENNIKSNIQDLNECFWHKIKFKVQEIGAIDNYDGLIFGGRSELFGGHDYKIFNPMTESEIQQIEADKLIILPDELKSYLLHFGAGGAGPAYGMVDFRKAFKETSFDKPFVYKDNYAQDGIEDFSGLMYIGTAGCGSDYFLEIKGNSAGTVWCNWGDGGCGNEGDFCEFYRIWIDDTYSLIINHQHNKLQEIKVKSNDHYTKEDYELAIKKITDKSNGKAFQCNKCQFPVEYNRLALYSFVFLLVASVITGIIGNYFYDSWWYSLAGGVISIVILAFLDEELTSKPSRCPACRAMLKKPLKEIT